MVVHSASRQAFKRNSDVCAGCSPLDILYMLWTPWDDGGLAELESRSGWHGFEIELFPSANDSPVGMPDAIDIPQQ